MPKSKHRKNHKKKVIARNKKIADEKKRMQKIQQMYLEQMIEQAKKQAELKDKENTENIVDVDATEVNEKDEN